LWIIFPKLLIHIPEDRTDTQNRPRRNLAWKNRPWIDCWCPISGTRTTQIWSYFQSQRFSGSPASGTEAKLNARAHSTASYKPLHIQSRHKFLFSFNGLMVLGLPCPLTVEKCDGRITSRHKTSKFIVHSPRLNILGKSNGVREGP